MKVWKLTEFRFGVPTRKSREDFLQKQTIGIALKSAVLAAFLASLEKTAERRCVRLIGPNLD